MKGIIVSDLKEGSTLNLNVAEKFVRDSLSYPKLKQLLFKCVLFSALLYVLENFKPKTVFCVNSCI